MKEGYYYLSSNYDLYLCTRVEGDMFWMKNVLIGREYAYKLDGTYNFMEYNP